MRISCSSLLSSVAIASASQPARLGYERRDLAALLHALEQIAGCDQ